MPRWMRSAIRSSSPDGTAKRHEQAHNLIFGPHAEHVIADRAYDADNLIDTILIRAANR
jgi:hypothetical protein